MTYRGRTQCCTGNKVLYQILPGNSFQRRQISPLSVRKAKVLQQRLSLLRCRCNYPEHLLLLRALIWRRVVEEQLFALLAWSPREQQLRVYVGTHENSYLLVPASSYVDMARQQVCLWESAKLLHWGRWIIQLWMKNSLSEQLRFISVNKKARHKSAMGQVQLMDHELDYSCPDKQHSKQEIGGYVFSAWGAEHLSCKNSYRIL